MKSHLTSNAIVVYIWHLTVLKDTERRQMLLLLCSEVSNTVMLVKIDLNPLNVYVFGNTNPEL